MRLGKLRRLLRLVLDTGRLDEAEWPGFDWAGEAL